MSFDHAVWWTMKRRWNNDQTWEMIKCKFHSLQWRWNNDQNGRETRRSESVSFDFFEKNTFYTWWALPFLKKFSLGGSLSLSSFMASIEYAKWFRFVLLAQILKICASTKNWKQVLKSSDDLFESLHVVDSKKWPNRVFKHKYNHS